MNWPIFVLSLVYSAMMWWLGWDTRGDWDSRQRDENYDAMRARLAERSDGLEVGDADGD